jgi:hypothetical protein
VALAAATLATACANPASQTPDEAVDGHTSPTTPSPPSLPSPPPSVSPSPSGVLATPAPAWLGTRILEPGPTGFPPPQPTPPELFPRSIRTVDLLPPPEGDTFGFTVDPVSDDVAARSTWHEGCPVTQDDLRHVTVTFVGFDGDLHTGELLVHADATEAIEQIFRAMFEARFPLEQLAITSREDLEAPATGDGNTTGAFVCRETRGSSAWSEHAYGRALDINPFHNPYVRDTERGRVVLPELATGYTDRSLGLPGMLVDGGPVVSAITAAGWTWGGNYRTLTDPMHASSTGR